MKKISSYTLLTVMRACMEHENSSTGSWSLDWLCHGLDSCCITL